MSLQSWYIESSGRRKLALVAFAVLLFAMSELGLTARRLIAMAHQTLAAGGRFPNLQVHDRWGRPVSLSSGAGRRALVIVAKPECGHCAVELGYLDRLAASLPPAAPLLVVVVEPDDSGDQVRDFLSSYGSRLTIYVDVNHELLSRYPGTRVPSLFFIREDGLVDSVIVGERGADYLMKRIQEFAGAPSAVRGGEGAPSAYNNEGDLL